MKKRLTRIAFLINAFLFLKGGFDAFGLSDYTFSGVQLIAAILNLLFLSGVIKRKLEFKLVGILHVINISVAAYTAYLMILAGKKYIQFGWVLVALFSLFLLVRHLIKRMKGNPNDQ